MKNKVILFYLLLIIPLAVVSCETANKKVPVDSNLRTGKLQNGLTYYIRHNNVPEGRANFYIAQKVGSILEEEKQRGLAHFLEHMCFNGTKNFPGNTLITELEKKGIGFGSNINAYTSIDETVYRLTDIPVQREGVIDTALLVLHDWSGFVSLLDQDIEDERGVIREEWRTTSSGNTRMLDKVILPTIYKGTPYANRMPIGSIDVINNFKPKEIRDYYKKWYRPDLQAIVVVGDINVNQVEEKLKSIFSDILTPVNPAERKYVKIPDNAEPIIAIASDPEENSSSVMLYWKKGFVSPEARNSLKSYKNSLIDALNANMLNSRFSEMYNKPDRPFDYASAQMTQFFISSFEDAWLINGLPVKNDVATALRAMLTESYRLSQYGFVASELERAKKSLLRSLETEYNNRGTIESNSYAQKYIQLFLKGEPAPGIDWKYKYANEIVHELSLSEINQRAKHYVSDSNMVVIATVTEKEGKELPTKEQLMNVIKEVKNQSLDSYVDEVTNEKLMDKKPEPGKVVETENAAFGYTQWTLSNGATVQIKDTDSKEDQLIIYGFSPGGRSLIDYEDLPSSYFSLSDHGIENMSEKQLRKLLAGKDLNFNVRIANYSEFVSGSSSLKDIETLFQLAYLKMVKPGKDKDVFSADTSKLISWCKNRLSDPNMVLQDTIRRMRNSYNPRADVRYDPEMLKKADLDKLYNIYKKRFNNASDFTFFITGNVNIDSIKPLVETYIGGLPNLRGTERPVDHSNYPLKGKVENHFTHKMETPKSRVNIYYSKVNPYNMQTEILDSYLGRILRTIFLETIREKEGGTYSVFVGGGWPCATKGYLVGKHYNLRIAFDTDPALYEKLIGLIYKEVQNMMEHGPSQEQLDKVKSYLLKRHQEQIREEENGYWSSIATTYFVYGVDKRTNYKQFIESVSPKMVKDYARKIFSTENVMEIVMSSE